MTGEGIQVWPGHGCLMHFLKEFPISLAGGEAQSWAREGTLDKNAGL